ncbi:MAG: dienelactone hydrolase family protein [Candidatus Sumerlaeaceae bacterium]
MSFSPDDQANTRARLRMLLGRLPAWDRPISAVVQGEPYSHAQGFMVQKLELELNGIEPVPAYYVRPAGRDGERLPAVLYHHSHGGEYHIGKEELLAGRGYMQSPGYAAALTRAGFAALVIDCWNFGERHRRTETSVFKEMLWKGQILWGMMLYDAVRSLDYLVSRNDVDPSRIGTLGMSMGSTLAWWLAALDPRIAACVDICCLTDFHALIEYDALDEHGVYYYVPDLLNHFSTSSINALICPRPHLSLAGTLDPLTPARGLDRIDSHLKTVYGNAGAGEAWKLMRQDVGHQETPEMRSETLGWLQRWLASSD